MLYFTESRHEYFEIRYEKRDRIVLFKSPRNCKRCDKGNFTLKSNSNKIMLGGGR